MSGDPLTGFVIRVGAALTTTGASWGFKRLKATFKKSFDEKKALRRQNQLRKVKTILHRSKPVDLADFYYIPEAEVPSPSSSTATKRLRQVSDLPPNQNYIVLGLAGEGKSMLLRFFAIQILAEDEERIPLFIELRALHQSENLAELILSELLVTWIIDYLHNPWITLHY